MDKHKNMQKKSEAYDKIDKIKRIAKKSIKNGKIELALTSVSVAGHILYDFNQYYYDEDLEGDILNIARYIYKEKQGLIDSYTSNSNNILFYDSFGLDSRGVTRIYLNALIKNGYNVVYVSPLQSADLMPKTKTLLSGCDNVIWKNYDKKGSYKKEVDELLKIIFETRPQKMIFYSTPWDSAGATVFAVMNKKVERFLIDLTDHAFWIGVKSNDFFTGSRDISASNLLYERNVKKNNIIRLGGSILPDDYENGHLGLPFDVQKKRYVFSGGALYKTLGDQKNTYYRIVDHILENHTDIYFLYAGKGNTSVMDKIIEKYPERAFLIDERPDYYYLIKNCVFFLNTYPMFGGMMMKYSAYAGKLPITLIHEEDSEGLLIDQKNRRIEYSSYEELVADVDHLLKDDRYLQKREQLLKGSIISEEDFIVDIKDALEKHKTRYDLNWARIDTTKFRQEYLERFEMRKTLDTVSTVKNKALFIYFPSMIYRIAKRRVSRVCSLKRRKK